MDADALVADYLGRLRAATWPLPAYRRDELVAEVAEHIEAAMAESGRRDEVTVRNVLDRLGEPEAIAAAEVGEGRAAPAEGQPATASQPLAGGVELVSLLLLAFGGIVPIIGVLAGYALTFLSTRWTGRDRVYAGAFLLGAVALAIILTVPPVATSGPAETIGLSGPAAAMVLLVPGGWLAGVFLILALVEHARARSR
jgi:uncharacterized membrane protein